MTDRPGSAWKKAAAALGVVAATLALMIATEPRLSMGWDEGYGLAREARVRLWFELIVRPLKPEQPWPPPWTRAELVEDKRPVPGRDRVETRSALLSPGAIAWFWPFAREEPHGHPPFYALVGLMGDLLAPRWADLPRARLGPMIVFSLAAGAIFAATRSRWGIWPAALATGAWALQPQLFALGHYAAYDGILTSLWVGAILVFASAVEPSGNWLSGAEPRWRWVLAFGVLCGWAADTKFTGWFLPLPFVAWALISRSRRGFWTLAVGGLIAALTLFLFNPVWWSDPVGGLILFFRSNLSRGKTIPIPVLFLGQVIYTPNQSLPWFNTLLWTAIATPVGFLLFAIVGAVRSLFRGRDTLATLTASQWAFLLLLRAMPHTPGHDGIRQFLPAFGCLAIVAGAGAALALSRWKTWGRVLVTLALCEGAVSLALIMPVPLSYFSPIVGGLPGAAKIGMEPTYFWDALTGEALERLRETTPPGRTVRFATFPTSWVHLRRTGVMEFGVYPIDPGPPAWYVVQNRPGQFGPLDRALVRRAQARHVLVEKFGVPLVWAFPYDEVSTLTGEADARRGAP